MTYADLLTACLNGTSSLIWLHVERQRARQRIEQIVLLPDGYRSPMCNVVDRNGTTYRVVVARKILSAWLSREIEWNGSANSEVEGVSVAADVDWSGGTNPRPLSATTERRHVGR